MDQENNSTNNKNKSLDESRASSDLDDKLRALVVANDEATMKSGKVKTFSCKEIAEAIGVSEEEIQAIEQSALKKLDDAGIPPEMVRAAGELEIKKREEELKQLSTFINNKSI